LSATLAANPAQLCGSESLLWQGRRGLCTQTVEDETELAPPELRRDTFAQLADTIASPKEQREILRAEVGAEHSLVLGATYEQLDQRTHTPAHRRGALAAMRPRLDHVLERAVSCVQDQRLLDELAEASPRIGIRERRLGDTDKLVERILENGVDECLALREMPVQRAHAHTGGVGDLPDGDLDAARGEKIASRRDQTRTVASSIDPDAAARNRDRHAAKLAESERMLRFR
jgi:hypothetical protein